VPAVSVVAGGLLALVALRLWLAWEVPAPWIMVDELIYSELAKSFAGGGEFLLRDYDTKVFSLLYPVLIAPAWLASDTETAYGIAKTINVLLMGLAAVPLYLWSRRLLRPAYALPSLGLFLVLPAFFYTGTLMTENAFLPAFLLAAFAFALALERPTLLLQGLALASIGVAAAVRLQGLVLVVVLVSAIALKALLDLRTGGSVELKRYWPTGAVLGLAAVAYVALKAVEGSSLSSGLGPYRAVAGADYSASEAFRWVVYHFAELPLAVGLVPASALILLLGLALRGRPTTPAERAFLAVAVAATFWLVVQVGVFASRFSLRIEERNMFYVAPLLLLALALWLQRGSPRPRLLAAVAALAPLALLLVLPFGRLLNPDGVSDAFGLFSLLELAEAVGVGSLRYIVLAGGAGLAALFLLLPVAAARVVLPLAVGAFLALSSFYVFERIREESLSVRATTAVGDELTWIDGAIGSGGSAGFLYTPKVNPHALWQTEFWNRSVGPVFNLSVRDPGNLPETILSPDPETGELDLIDAQPYPVEPGRLTNFVVHWNYPIIGEAIARRGEWILYRIGQPLRLASSVQGVSHDGWMGADASYTQYRGPAVRPGKVAVVVSRPVVPFPHVPGRARIQIGPIEETGNGGARLREVTASESWTIQRGVQKTFVLDAPAPPWRVEVHVEPTFSPSDYGSADTRELGVVVFFRTLEGS
jgi:hypothetical protein